MPVRRQPGKLGQGQARMISRHGVMRASLAAAVVMFAATATAQTARVSGTVIDSATRQPVAGAIISMRSGDRVIADRSDEAGAFSIPRLTSGTVVAEVKRIGYRV